MISSFKYEEKNSKILLTDVYNTTCSVENDNTNQSKQDIFSKSKKEHSQRVEPFCTNNYGYDLDIISKKETEFYYIYKDVNIMLLNVPDNIKEHLMGLFLEKIEYENLSIKYKNKLNEKLTLKNFEIRKLKSDQYVLMKQLEDFRDIIINILKHKSLSKLPFDYYKLMKKWGINYDSEEIANEVLAIELNFSKKSCLSPMKSSFSLRKKVRFVGKESFEEMQTNTAYTDFNHNDNSENDDFADEKIYFNTDKEAKRELKKKYKSLDEEYKKSCIEYEYRIENLTSSLNIKNSIMEDLHQRIKTLNEEYEDLLNKHNKEQEYINSLEENISRIKKENDTKVEELNRDLNELKLNLERNNYLSNEILSTKEKYEKAQQENFNLKHKNEALEKNIETFNQIIEKLNNNFEKKEKEIDLLNLKKKELENLLIKYAEKYGFKLNSTIFRNFSIINYENELENMLQRNSSANVFFPKEILFNKNLNTNITNQKSLQLIYENSDDERNESQSPYNIKKYSSDENENLKSYLNIQEDYSYKEDKDLENILEEKTTAMDSCKREGLKKFNKLNFKSEFITRDSKGNKINYLNEGHDISIYNGEDGRKLRHNYSYNQCSRKSLKDMLDEDLEDLNKDFNHDHKDKFKFDESSSKDLRSEGPLLHQPSMNHNFLTVNFFFQILNLTKTFHENMNTERSIFCSTLEKTKEDLSDNNLYELNNRIDELTIKNLELESILANEKFITQQQMKKQQAKIDKLLLTIDDIKKKMRSVV